MSIIFQKSTMLLSFLLWAYLLPGVHSAAHGHVRFHNKRSHTKSAPESQETETSQLFARNLEVDFEWGHPDLQRKLWAGVDPVYSASIPDHGSHALAKRAGAGERIELPPVLRDLHCLGCIDKAFDKVYTINELTTDWLETQLIKTDKQMENKCVFYTGITYAERPSWQPGTGRPGLSETASYFACAKSLFTLWHLFPGSSGNVAPGVPSDFNQNRRNFWEIDHEGSWLYGIHEAKDGRYTYFENMSEAMALHCSGRVWLMSLKPQNTLSYGTGTEAENNAHSIWKSKELPALRRMGKVTELISVTPTGGKGEYGKMYRLDINSDDLEVLGEYTGTVPRDLEHHLYARDTCTANVAYQPPGEDWFGVGR